MDRESLAVVKFLSVLAAAAGDFSAQAQSLKSDPLIAAGTSELRIRNYSSGEMIELYTSIELLEGVAFVWWIDVSWSESEWNLNASLRINHSEGEDSLHECPDQSTSSLDQACTHLANLTSDLLRIDVNEAVRLARAGNFM